VVRRGWRYCPGKCRTIGGERFHLTADGREDGSLGEVFIQWGKQGQTSAGLMDIYAAAWSVGLQHGAPLSDLVHQGPDLYFVPNGIGAPVKLQS
jgi:ribonucleoside-diphosphate reductase alpha chain